MLIGASEIQSLIPHSGEMCLLNSVTKWDATTITCTAQSHHDPDNPLACDGKLPILCGIEYAAQAMAVHGGLTRLEGQRPRAGLLVSVRDVVTRVKYLSDFREDLHIKVKQLLAGEAGVSYSFVLQMGEIELMTGRAMVVLDAAGVAGVST